ncbi:MAG: hypothetical protein OEW33_13875 [Nitrospirota bacterium]|nr:hypothetical protein [Nitrospirota bacterium]
MPFSPHNRIDALHTLAKRQKEVGIPMKAGLQIPSEFYLAMTDIPHRASLCSFFGWIPPDDRRG